MDVSAIKQIVEGALGPVANLIDNLSTSREEKDAAKIELAKAMGSLEGNFHNAVSSVIIAEATGKSWLQRNHRPLISVGFGFIVMWNYVFGPIGTWLAGIATAMFAGPDVVAVAFPVLDLPPGLWATISLCIGGYMTLRTHEKTTLGKESAPKLTKRQMKKILKALEEENE